MNGKTDTSRPFSVPRDTFAANWERTFAASQRNAAVVAQLEEQASRAVFAAVDRFVDRFAGLATGDDAVLDVTLQAAADRAADVDRQTFGATPPYREEDVTTETWSSGVRDTLVSVRVTHRPTGCQGEAAGLFRLETTLRARHAMERKMREAHHAPA